MEPKCEEKGKANPAGIPWEGSGIEWLLPEKLILCSTGKTQQALKARAIRVPKSSNETVSYTFFIAT